MNVAHPIEYTSGQILRRRFDHVVDNSGNSVGLVADRLAFTRRRQPDPFAARGGCDRFGHQPGDRQTSRLDKQGARGYVAESPVLSLHSKYIPKAPPGCFKYCSANLRQSRILSLTRNAATPAIQLNGL